MARGGGLSGGRVAARPEGWQLGVGLELRLAMPPTQPSLACLNHTPPPCPAGPIPSLSPVPAPACAVQVLRDADMVLAINGQPVSSYNDVERIIASAAAAAGGGERAQQPPAKRARTSDAGAGANGCDASAAAPAAAAGAPAADAMDVEPAAAQPHAAPADLVPGAAGEAGPGQALPAVSLTIFREGVVQEVSVR